MDSLVEKKYSQRLQELQVARRKLNMRSNLIAHLRMVVFVLLVSGLVVGLWDFGQPDYGWLMLSGLATLGFVGLIIAHAVLVRRIWELSGLMLLCEQASARCRREFANLPLVQSGFEEDQNGLARDLDLFGRASVFQLLGTVKTPIGRTTLATWLLQPAASQEIADRQQAVAELAPQLEKRQRLELFGITLQDRQTDLQPALRWAESAGWILKRPGLIWCARGLSAACLVCLVTNLLGLLGAMPWLLLALVNLTITGLFWKKLHQAFAVVGSKQAALGDYTALFAHLSLFDCNSPRLLPLVENMSLAHSKMAQLERFVSFLEVRKSFLLYLPLQVLGLWDFHWLVALERWKQQAGRQVGDWLAKLGEFEALCALASLSHDNPSWVYPEVDPKRDTIAAEGLGHPLLSTDRLVPNDVELGPPQRFLLVTGSNMSGKSTLLRALGVNLVLAMAGGPVCAKRLRLGEVVLGTSFRVQDSLDQGVSYFMAELTQLKQVVEASRLYQTSQKTFCYLLDEILLGTNVVERQIAVRRVMEHLLAAGAIGAIATHDLSLAEAPSLADVCRAVHFAEKFVSQDTLRMEFDYLLREGLSPATNALKLLKIVGLDA